MASDYFNAAFAPFAEPEQLNLDTGPINSNVLQQLSSVPTNFAPQIEVPRQRRSFLDTVGRISDVLARVGGAEALYQPTLDARQDRQQQVDLDTMRKQLLRQQVTAGAEAPQEAMRGRLAQALGAVADHPDAANLWPQIAQQAGIDPQKSAAIGLQLQQNPGSAKMLAQALGLQPQAQGSLPASIQNYAMYQRILAERGPQAAEEFMRFAQPEMEGIKPYQQAQLAQGNRDFQLEVLREQRRADESQRDYELRRQQAETKGVGSDLTPTQRGVVVQKVRMLPVVRQQLQRVKDLAAEMEQQGTLARGSVGGLVPGAVAGGTSERFDKAVGALRKSILSLTRTPGVGSMSDYETRLDEMQLPGRWGSDAGRAEAIAGIDTLISGLEQGYREMLPQQPSTSPTRGGGSRATITPRTPRGGRASGGGGWGNMTVR